MAILRYRAPLSLLELSRQVSFDPATVSRAIEQLCAGGLVLRERSAVDRRAVILPLTQDGHNFLCEQTPLVVKALNEPFTDFSRQDANTLIALLGRFLDSLISATEARRIERAPHETPQKEPAQS